MKLIKDKWILISIVLVATSCQTKQKAVNRINEKILIEKIEKLNQQIQENFRSDSVLNSGSYFLKTFEGIDIDLLQADSSKTIVIITSDGRQTKIKGANIKVSKQKEITQTKDTTVINVKKEGGKNTISESQSNKTSKTETRARTADTKTKGTGSRWVFIVIIALAFYVLYKFAGVLK